MTTGCNGSCCKTTCGHVPWCQVSSIEEQQHALTKTLKENAKLLEKMEATFAQNVKTVHSNIEALEVSPCGPGQQRTHAC